MINHPNRSRKVWDSFVIQLSNGRLWKSHGAESAALFSTLENAQATMAGLSGRGALANPKILRIVSGSIDGARLIEGYYTVEL